MAFSDIYPPIGGPWVGCPLAGTGRACPAIWEHRTAGGDAAYTPYSCEFRGSFFLS
jgi:hypothetical protein